MPRIRLRIGETREQMNARVSDAVQRWEAGEFPENYGADFGFRSWNHFAEEVGKLAPTFAAQLLTLLEAERWAFFDTPSGQAILRILWDRMSFDVNETSHDQSDQADAL